MHAPAPLMIKGYKWGDPSRTIKRKRGGTNKNNNSGPSGRQMRPAARMHKALADMAASYGVVNGVRKAGRGPRKQERAA